jgi:NAD-dependent SIR2 family protein deacetylase
MEPDLPCHCAACAHRFLESEGTQCARNKFVCCPRCGTPVMFCAPPHNTTPTRPIWLKTLPPQYAELF